MTDLEKTLYEALCDALPYVRGAYECAFPDEEENQAVARDCEKAIAKAELQMREGK